MLSITLLLILWSLLSSASGFFIAHIRTFCIVYLWKTDPHAISMSVASPGSLMLPLLLWRRLLQLMHRQNDRVSQKEQSQSCIIQQDDSGCWQGSCCECGALVWLMEFCSSNRHIISALLCCSGTSMGKVGAAASRGRCVCVCVFLSMCCQWHF